MTGFEEEFQLLWPPLEKIDSGFRDKGLGEGEEEGGERREQARCGSKHANDPRWEADA